MVKTQAALLLTNVQTPSLQLDSKIPLASLLSINFHFHVFQRTRPTTETGRVETSRRLLLSVCWSVCDESDACESGSQLIFSVVCVCTCWGFPCFQLCCGIPFCYFGQLLAPVCALIIDSQPSSCRAMRFLAGGRTACAHITTMTCSKRCGTKINGDAHHEAASVDKISLIWL